MDLSPDHISHIVGAIFGSLCGAYFGFKSGNRELQSLKAWARGQNGKAPTEGWRPPNEGWFKLARNLGRLSGEE